MNYSPLMPYGAEDQTLSTYWNPGQSITETSFTTMAKDTRVTFDSATPVPNKPNKKNRHSRVTERQISYEDAENCVNEMSESFPALTTRAHRLMRQVSGSFNNRTIKVALILSVILNLLLGIPFGIFFGFWMSQKDDAPSAPSTSSSASARVGGDRSYAIMESCFSCSDVDLELGSRVKVRSKNNICCTDDKIPALEGTAYYYLTAEYFRKKVVGGTDRGPYPCRPGTMVPGRGGGGSVAAAHMMLDVEQTKLNSQGQGNSLQFPLAWITDDPEQRSFVGDGVQYSDGQIQIRQSGKYHLYSHVTLSTNDNPLPDREVERIIVHSIGKKSRDDSTALLTAQITLKHNEVRSTNVEGSFDLLEGDSIYVYVSFPSFLKNTRSANVFGLFLL